MKAHYLNNLAVSVYTQNVERGWWDNPGRDLFQTLQLVNTEVAEATEADRRSLLDSHLPNRRGVEVELADALIRLLDLAGRYSWPYDPLAAPHALLHHAENLAACHLALTSAICRIGEAVLHAGTSGAEWEYSIAVSTILAIAERETYNLEAAVTEKLAYNKTRADHNRENRAALDGKKY